MGAPDAASIVCTIQPALDKRAELVACIYVHRRVKEIELDKCLQKRGRISEVEKGCYPLCCYGILAKLDAQREQQLEA